MPKPYQNHGTAKKDPSSVVAEGGVFSIVKIQNLGNKTLSLDFNGDDGWWELASGDTELFPVTRLTQFRVKCDNGSTKYQIYAIIL